MKQLKVLFAFIILALTLGACKNFSSGWMSSSSASNEVLTIIDKTEWEEPHGRALFDVLNSPMSSMPQKEANFKILQIDPKNFTSTFKMARNIVEVDVSSDYTQTKMSAEINKYASGQVVLTIKAPDKDAMETFLKENSDKIVEYLVNKELERIAQWLKKDSATPKTRIRNTFGFELAYPKGLSNITEDNNFFWATNNSAESRQDISIFSIPYTSETVFEKDSLIAIRNRVLGKHIKGSFDSQMVTSKTFRPEYRKLEIDGLFRAEIRGLWEMTTDMMGGPFVMQAFVNENTNRVIFVDVLVYAPEKKKRNLIRNMEGTFYTIKVSDSQE
ncbi:MAG: DUF4837 family protein [Bacteroidales bacterium]|nr:DUF4837 family protein [Bacteroidales bacterium]